MIAAVVVTIAFLAYVIQTGRDVSEVINEGKEKLGEAKDKVKDAGKDIEKKIDKQVKRVKKKLE